jgi:5-methylcytosine-specific restriction endonuclease McrA
MESITEKKCIGCGKTEKMNDKTSRCATCRSVYNKQWRTENADKKSQCDKRWALENKDKVKENHKRWLSNPLNSLKIAVLSKMWREENKDRAREQGKKWRKNNKDLSISFVHERRARLRGAEGKYTVKEWNNLIEKYCNKCVCCGRTDVKLTVDHVKPLIAGGNNTIDNIQPLCKSCNSSKGAKHIDYRK